MNLKLKSFKTVLRLHSKKLYDNPQSINMIKLRLFIFLFLSSSFCFSQEIPCNKYDSRISYRTYKNKLDRDKPKMFTLSYNHTNYLNDFYGEAIESGDLKYSFGASLFYRRQIAKQFIIDGEIFYNQIKSTDMVLENFGFEIDGGIILMPFTLKITSILQPYISFGYQSSAMDVLSSENAAIVSTLKGKTVNTSAPVWKTGIMINVSKAMFMNFQYKQSFSTSKDRDFNAWSTGLGLRY